MSYLSCNFIQLLSNSESPPVWKIAAYLVHHMSSVYSNQSRWDSLPCGFMDRVLKLIVPVPDIALLNFKVNKYLVYLDVCNLHSELS